MTIYAEVVSGSVIGILRTPKQLEKAPKGKRLPVVEENTDYDNITQFRIGPEVIVESDRVVFRHTVIDFQDAADRLAEHVKSKLTVKFEEEASVVRNGYSDSTVATFDQQKEEAIKYSADNNFPTPMLDALAANRGVDKETVITRILQKAEIYSITMGTLLGKYQGVEDMIDVAVEVEDLDELRRIENEELNEAWI